MAHQTRADDERVLAILDMYEGDGVADSIVARKFGITRSVIRGLIHRTLQDTKAVHPCRCRKKANKDGGMKRGWWRGQ